MIAHDDDDDIVLLVVITWTWSLRRRVLRPT